MEKRRKCWFLWSGVATYICFAMTSYIFQTYNLGSPSVASNTNHTCSEKKAAEELIQNPTTVTASALSLVFCVSSEFSIRFFDRWVDLYCRFITQLLYPNEFYCFQFALQCHQYADVEEKGLQKSRTEKILRRKTKASRINKKSRKIVLLIV